LNDLAVILRCRLDLGNELAWVAKSTAVASRVTARLRCPPPRRTLPSANPETGNVEISLARFFIFAAPNRSRDATIATYRDT